MSSRPEEMQFLSTEDIIRMALYKFRARRGDKFISVGDRTMRVRTDGERTVTLPNQSRVKITTDASGHATQIEEAESMHAVARPDTYKVNLNLKDMLNGR